QRDELLHNRTQLFRLGHRGFHPVVLQQGRGHVVQHGTPVLGRPAELAILCSVPHQPSSGSISPLEVAGGMPGLVTTMSPSVSSKAIPKFSPSRRNSSAISESAF